MDDSYRNNLLALGLLSSVLLVSQPTRRSELNAKQAKEVKENPKAKLQKEANHPQANIYRVYFFIVAAGWLQEIYLYGLYQNEYGLSKALISTLFITGFATSAVSSLFVGALADHYGRKSINVAFTAFYGVSACLAMIPQVPVLFAGRIFGGVAASIFFSVLDSWIVTDFHARKLVTKGCDLYRTFGTLAVINCFSAVACGVLGERLVSATGSRRAPFWASWLLMWQAMQAVWSGFKEVYGASSSDDMELVKSTPSLFTVFKRPYIWALTLATTVFEGSMYQFAYTAMPTLKSVHKGDRELPSGYIFACVMASALAGALVFNIAMQKRKMRFSRLLVLVLVVSNFVFYKLSRPTTERATFWLFCLFGACIGLYWPCMGTLKGRMVEEGIRSTVYSAMRAPLYVFVVAQLLRNQDAGDVSKMFSTSSMWFTAAFAAVWII
ncbi:hypothetical protein BJ170DRAFT_560979, partial [Xylariales sp. AK1849]